MKKNFIFSIILFIESLLLVFLPRVVYADGGASAALAAGAALAIKKADEAGLFDCSFHLGADQCRRLDRCNRARKALERAKDGNETALKQLDQFVGASGMQRNCVRSLEGGHFDALVTNINELRKLSSADKNYQGAADASSRSANNSSTIIIVNYILF